MQPCSAGYLACIYCTLVCVIPPPPESIQLLLHFVQIPPPVCDAILTPVSLWRPFELCVTSFAEQSNTCACVEHSSSRCYLPGGSWSRSEGLPAVREEAVLYQVIPMHWLVLNSGMYQL